MQKCNSLHIMSMQDL